MFWVLCSEECVTEMVHLSTHNIRFGWEIRKIIIKNALLSGGLSWLCLWQSVVTLLCQPLSNWILLSAKLLPNFYAECCHILVIIMYLKAELKQSGYWSDGFVRSQLILIYSVFKKIALDITWQALKVFQLLYKTWWPPNLLYYQ